MFIVAVVNAKGGSGKSTVSTNVAGYFAACGEPVMLGDYDRQLSSLTWLKSRPADARPIEGWELDEKKIMKPPAHVTRVVLDTPAGLRKERLKQVVQRAHVLLVPVGPSPFDIAATDDFFDALVEDYPELMKKQAIATIGVRVNSRASSFKSLSTFLESLPIPCLTYLRESQQYLNWASTGTTVFDQPPHKVEKDLQQWAPVTAWLDQHAKIGRWP